MDQATLQLHKSIASAVVLAGIDAGRTALNMAQKSLDKAIWSPRETTALVDYLYEHHSEGDWGNFKDTTFDDAAVFISPFLETGAVKTGIHCRKKWQKVCYPRYFCLR